MVRKGVRLVVAVLAAGCGGKTTTPEVHSATSEAAPPATSSWEPAPLPEDGAIGALGLGGPDKPWDDMSYEEKEWYMVGKVHPIMRQVFQTYDHDKYEGEKFECAPCHGDDAAAKKYKMPSDHLSPVPAFGSEDWKSMENAKIVKFMSQRVNPVMAKIMGKPEFDPSTGEGYSCWACHPKE